MAHDPLTDYTRKTRKSLIAVSSASLCVSFLGLRVEDVPFLGLKLTMDEKAIPIILTGTILYLLITFYFHFLGDLLDKEFTGDFKGQEDLKKKRQSELMNNLIKLIEQHVPELNTSEKIKIRNILLENIPNPDKLTINELSNEIFNALLSSIDRANQDMVNKLSNDIVEDFIPMVKKYQDYIKKKDFIISIGGSINHGRLVVLDMLFPMAMGLVSSATLIINLLSGSPVAP